MPRPTVRSSAVLVSSVRTIGAVSGIGQWIGCGSARDATYERVSSRIPRACLASSIVTVIGGVTRRTLPDNPPFPMSSPRFPRWQVPASQRPRSPSLHRRSVRRSALDVVAGSAGQLCGFDYAKSMARSLGDWLWKSWNSAGSSATSRSINDVIALVSSEA